MNKGLRQVISLIKKGFACVLLATGFLSCTSEEAPNAECDLLSVRLCLDKPANVLYFESDTLRLVSESDKEVKFNIRKGGFDLDSLKLNIKMEYTVTPGATIEETDRKFLDNGSTICISLKTTSEDEKWNREYQILFVATTSNYSTAPTVIEFGFEDWTTEKAISGAEWYVCLNGDNDKYWATGNAGYAIPKKGAALNEYPTAMYENGYEGKAAVLTTKETGFANMGFPIAAGNLFIGTFDATNAMSDAMASTVQGHIFQMKPNRIEFYAKYKAGDVYKVKVGAKQEVDNTKTDHPDFYAALYRNKDKKGNEVLLHGDDGKTNENIVAKAFMKEEHYKDLNYVEWKKIVIDFEYLEEIDEKLLENNGYNLELTFSASYDGGNFNGAEGSTFIVDELKIYCNFTEEELENYGKEGQD